MFIEGQEIREDELLLEVETDKAAVEIPSPCTGTSKHQYMSNRQATRPRWRHHDYVYNRKLATLLQPPYAWYNNKPAVLSMAEVAS